MTVDDELRAAAFSWLREQIDPATSIVLRTGMMEGFEHAGRRYTLMSQKGIWKPRGFEVPLSITTTTNGPYDDTFTDDGLLAYRYHSDPWTTSSRCARTYAAREDGSRCCTTGVAGAAPQPVW